MAEIPAPNEGLGNPNFLRAPEVKQLAELLPFGMHAIHAIDGSTVFSNSRAEQLFKRPHNPDVPLNQPREYPIRKAGTDAEYPFEQNPVTQAMGGKAASVSDMEIDQDGRRVPVEIVATPVRNEVGEVEIILITATDITERKKTEAEAIESAKLGAVHATGTLVQHEITNALQHAYAMELLPSMIVDPEGHEILEQAMEGVERAGTFAQQLHKVQQVVTTLNRNKTQQLDLEKSLKPKEPTE